MNSVVVECGYGERNTPLVNPVVVECGYGERNTLVNPFVELCGCGVWIRRKEHAFSLVDETLWSSSVDTEKGTRLW